MNKPHASLALLVLAFLTVSCAATRQDLTDPASNLPFSKAVRVGHTVYVSGHLGRDPATGNAPADVAEEVELMLDAFSATLTSAGVGMNNLVQVQVFCTDLSLYETFNNLYRARFDQQFPSRAFIGAGSLLRGCRFEIVGIAAD